MKFKIVPYNSVGNFHFNVERNVNRKLFLEHEDLLYCHARTDGKSPDDSYDKLGVTLIYNKYNKFTAIEIQSPTNPVFQEKELLRMTWNELLLWFHKLDEDLVISEKDFISYKLGISVFAPDYKKNPDVLPKTITVFAKDFFSTKKGIPSPNLINSFHIQVAYMEPQSEEIVNEKTIEELLSKIWKNTKEKGIILWNQIPISFDYAEDLSQIISQIAKMLNIINANVEGKETFQINCNAFETSWVVKWNNKFILIDADWKRIRGNYEVIFKDNNLKLNQLTLLKSDFIAEWKMLLVQALNVLTAKNTSNVKNKKQLVCSLKKTLSAMPNYGKFYDENQKIVLVNSTGRKVINFRKLNLFKQSILVAFILIVVITPVYLYNKSAGFYAMFLKYLVPTVILSIVITIILLYLIKRQNK